ncbi:hypothetical protein [Synechococcus sp. CCY 9618]|uniref:hypothetical protein n=1 Tax=Synechococcus sp. CCY 9618 TaxID=2815602 RepID=UPI001C219F77|nr:hypothetical protein [Synechococcus sp. CCY 9618]
MKATGLLASALSAAVLVLVAQERASAVLVYELVELGDGSVRLTVSGSLSNLPAPTLGPKFCGRGATVGYVGQGGLCTGAEVAILDYFYALSGPTSLPVTGAPLADAAGGDLPTYLDLTEAAPRLYAGFGPDQNFLYGIIPSGQPISSISSFSATTFRDLGLDGLTAPLPPLVWSILNAPDPNAIDTVELRIIPFSRNGSGNPTSVPGPLPLAGGAAAFAWSRRLRARLRSFSSPRA